MAKSIFQISPLDAELQRQAEDMPPVDMSAPDLPDIPRPQPLALPPAPKGAERGAPVGGPVAVPPRLKSAFEKAALRYDVPINVLMALGEQESRYNPVAIGVPTQWGRAKGVMQYLDGTAAKLGINPFDPDQAIDAAARQLRERLSKGYSMRDAVQEHFAGPDRRLWKAKTRRYGEEVLGRAARLKRELAPQYGAWYSPGAEPDARQQGPVSAAAIAQVTGASARQPQRDASIASTLGNPHSLKAVVARHESEKQRLPNEGGISAPRQPAPTFGNALAGAGVSAKEAFRQAGQGVRMQFEDLAGDEIDAWMAERMPNAPGLSLEQQRELFGKTNTQRDYERSTGRAAAATPQFESWWADAAYGGLQSLIQTTPGMAAGILAGPGVGLAVLGGQTQAQSYAKYRERGATPGMALLGATGEGAVEIATEMLPMGWLADKFGKVGFQKFLSAYLLREMPTEQAATFLQAAIDTAIANPDKTWGDFWGERVDAAGKTAVATLMQTGAFAGVNAALRRVAAEDVVQAEAMASAPASDATGSTVDSTARPTGPVARAPATASPVEASPPAPAAATAPPMPAGPMARAMARAPVIPVTEPGAPVAVPEPVAPEIAQQPMTLATGGAEYPVTLIGETPDAIWVKTDTGEELQIPRAEIDAGVVQLAASVTPQKDVTTEAYSAPSEAVEHIASNEQNPEFVKDPSSAPTVPAPADVKESLTTEPQDRVKQPLAVPSASDQADSSADLPKGMKAIGAGMAAALIDMYHAQASAGTVNDKAGAVSPILQVAKKVRERRGGDELAREEIETIARAVDGVTATGQERQAAMQAIVDQFAPEAIDPETGEVLTPRDAPVAAPPSLPKIAAPAAPSEGATEPELRARLKYLSSQARTNAGWTKPLIAEKKRVEAAIDAMNLAREPAASPVVAAAETIAAAEAEAATSPLNDRPEPTDAQKDAGNYKLGHALVGGLDVSIENPAGTSRRPEWPPLKHSYGYVKRSEGADGDHVDVFLGPKAADPTNPVFIVDQINQDGSFDEHKVMVGFADKGAARRGYLANYEKGWQGLGDITPMPFDQFKEWVKDPVRTIAPAGSKVRPVAQTVASSSMPIPAAEDVAEPRAAQAVADSAPPVDMLPPPAHSPAAALPQSTAVPLGAPVPQRPTDRKNPNPYVRKGEQVRFTEQVEYLGGDSDSYVVESVGNKEAWFVNERTGGRSSLKNYQMQQALRRGVMQPLERSALAPAAADAKGQKHRDIDDGFTANRAVLHNFKRGDKVEFDHGSFHRDGTARTFAGTVDKVQDKDQGTVRVIADSGADYTVAARNLRKVQPGAQSASEPTPAPAASASSTSTAFADNKLFTADKVEAARARLREKMGRLNSGVDPEVLIDGMTIAGAYIEAGMRRFADYAQAMRDDFGPRITPYLLSFWEGARNYPSLDTAGMTPPDVSRAAHAALLAEGLPVEEAQAIGTEVAKPKAKPKTSVDATSRVLKSDWHVSHIDGRTPIDGGQNIETDSGLKGGLKDAFLADAVGYLRAVAATLKPLGFVPHISAKGKEENPVARHPAGPAVSGDVSLHVRHADSGANVYVTIGASSMRGAVPTNGAGVAIMYRVSMKEGDKQAGSGVNRWAPVDLTVVDLADTIAWEAGRNEPELSRDHVREPEPVGQGVNRRGVPADEGGRESAAQQGSASAHSGDLGAAQPADVGKPSSPGPDSEDGVRGAGTDVAPAGRADEGGPAGDGRAGASGAGRADAGTGKRSVRRRGDGATELDLFGDVTKKIDSNSPSAEPVQIMHELPSLPSSARTGPGNFLISNPLDIVGGGPVARFDRNRQAIETYNAIRDDGRAATADEQRVLAGYTGWGSFGQELFQGTWERPMPKDGWAERDRWLREHMGKDEWQSAQRSITNAHYTDPPTVMAMWAMMERMGFAGGRVLEPSMGIGNFFGMMPAAIAGRSQLSGVELDSLTGGMAQLLYPDANIRVMGYQDSKTPDGFYDAVIGNWPFENTVIADRRYDRLSPFLHDYFFLKALDQVRAGGIVMGITSSGTMDKKATGIRRELAKKGELLAAFRLPSGAFAEYAGTKVVTDIVILRKRGEPIALADNEGWINSVPYQAPGGEVFLNEYYVANPGHVIGTIDFGHGTTRGRPGLIVHRPDDMAEQLRRIVQSVPEGAYIVEQKAAHISYVANHTADREGALTNTDNGLFIVRGEQLAPAADVVAYAIKDVGKTAARVDQLERLVDLRQKYATLIDAERSGDAGAARKALKAAYDGFVGKYGSLGDSYGLAYLRKIDDPFYPAVAALEIDGKPAAILSRSTTRTAPPIDKPSIAQAFVLERNAAVNPPLSAIAARVGVTPEVAKADLLRSGAVFELPSGDVMPSDMYLSGNVREKLRQARAAVAEGMDHLQRNVAALAAVVPADVPYFKIETQLGATWVAPDIYAEFVGHMLGLPDGKGIEVRYNGGRWTVRIEDRVKGRPEASTGFGTGEYSFQRLVNAAFSNQTVTIRRKDSDGSYYVDHAATEEVNGKISEMRTKFADWLWSDPERRVAVEAEYNEVRNAFATPKFDGSFLRFEGMALSLGNGPFDLRQHQVDAIWRALVTRRSLNAHEVGTGKTFTMGGIAVESRRYGIARKPLILAHNANSKTVGAEIQQMYPAAKILYIDNLSPDTIDVKMRQIANDDWDAIVVPHSLIDRFSFREETLMEMAREEIAALEEEAYAAAEDDGVKLDDKMLDDPEELKKLRSPTAKELVKMRQRIIETIRKQSHRASREGAIPFEELGVDMLMVDEAHEFKKPPIATRMKMKGLNTQTSDRSIALSFLTRYVRAQNSGGNVHLFTGTPITNTLTEVFHMMRYIMAEEMQAAGVDQWDGWFGSFAREVMDVEQNAAAEYEAVTRLAGFINVPELRRMIGQYMDVVFAENMPEMQPRRTASGKTMADALTEAERAELLNGRTEGATDRPYKKVINVTSDLTPQQKVIFEELRGHARRWRSMTGKARRDAMAAGAPESPIITEGLAAKASFDVRLYDGEALAGQEGQAFDDPGSKASLVVANVKEIYDSHAHATQVIFAEQGFSNRVTRSLGRDDDGNRRTRTFPSFSTIRDIVERLVASGISRTHIAIVDGSTTKDKRKEIALKMNAAKIRVVIGSTATLGVGVNMQKNLRAMHHMDAPWMPGDLEQRNGRGQRQANQWNTVLEYRYLTDRLDGRRWQVLAIKQRFITAFLKADDSARTIEGEAAADEQSDILQSFAEAAGDPRILIREKLRKQLDGAQRRERLHTQGIANALGQARRMSREIEETQADLDVIEQRGMVETVRKLVADNAGKGFGVTVDGKSYDKRKEADEALGGWAAFNMRVGDEPRAVGRFGGHELMIGWPYVEQHPVLRLVIDGKAFSGSTVQGLEQSLRKFSADVEHKQRKVVEQRASVDRLQAVAQEPFHLSDELARYEKALDALEADIKVNPVPPPAWLRTGAPVDTDVVWQGKAFTVSGHRWTADGWFVLASDGAGDVTIPYLEAKDTQGINVYEERPFEAPDLVEKEVKVDSAAPADSPAAYSIGVPAGRGFVSADGLRQHLAGSSHGSAIGAMIDAGKIVLHDDVSTLLGQGGLHSAATDAWARNVDRIMRGERPGRFVSVSRVTKLLRNMGLNAAEIVMSSAKIARVRVEHPELSLDILKALPRLLEQPEAIFPSDRRDGSLIIAVPAQDSNGDPVVVPITAAPAGPNVVLSIYGKEQGLNWIRTRIADARKHGDPVYVREGFAGAVPKPDPASPKEASSSSPAPIAAERPAKPVRRILTLRKESNNSDGVQAMTTPDGRIHLVANKLTSQTAIPVLLHEMFHAGVRPLIGEAAWSSLLNRLGALYRSAATREVAGDRDNSWFWHAALDRVELARPATGQEVEEFAAYAIEQRAMAPAGVRDLVDRLVGAVKAWLLRRFGRQVGAITPAQMQALAIAALRSGTTAPRGTQDAAYSRVVPSVESIDAATPGLIANLVTKAMDGKTSVLGLIPLRPLLSEMGSRLPAAREYLVLKQAMDQTRDQWHSRSDKVAQPWLKFRMLHRADNRQLMDLMHEATLAGVDPAQPFTSILTAPDRKALSQGPGSEAYDDASDKAKKDENRRADHGRLGAAYAALPAEGKRIYADVRDTYRALSAAFEQTLLDNLSKALDIKFRQAKRAYDAELIRIADSDMASDARELAQAKAEREWAKQRQLQGWAKGARMTRLRAFFETNNLSGPYFPLARFGNFFVTVRDKDGDQVISFSRFEKPAEQQAFARQMKADGHGVTLGVLDDGGALKAQVDARFVTDIESILEGADVSEGVRDAVWQRWLETMPDMSIRTSRIHRKGRAGFSADAIRAFGHHMFHGSHQLARLKYALDLDETVALARDQAKTMPDPVRAGLIVNEMARRNQFIMNPTGGPLAQALTSAAFIYHLSVSPAAAMVNTAQTAVMGIPILAAYDGHGGRSAARAAFELNKALRDFALGAGHAARSRRLSPVEKAAMEEAYETGLIERTQSHDLAGVGETGVEYSAVRTKVMGAISWAFHHTERMNREVTFLAAYRMSRRKGEPHNMAIDRAAELTWKTHFDYQNTSRPRVMQSDTAKVLLTFRNFQVNMLWRLFRDTHQAVKGGTVQERREARTQLAGITGMMLVTAGIRGTWMYGIAMMLAALFFGDDAEDDFSKAMIEALGTRLGGMALNGVPGDVLGIDISERVGMPDLWFRSPDRQLEGTTEFDYWAMQFLGAGVGVLRNAWSGASMIADGKVYRGIETMMPKFAKDLMRAQRYLSEGARTLKGDPIIEDMPPADAVKQALGFTPAELAERYDRNRSMKNKEQRIVDERGTILSDYDQAARSDDDTTEIEARIDSFNAANPDYPITVRTLRQSMKSRQRMRDSKIGGVNINPKLADRLQEEAPPLVYEDEPAAE